jgi:hypothetical protein
MQAAPTPLPAPVMSAVLPLKRLMLPPPAVAVIFSAYMIVEQY